MWLCRDGQMCKMSKVLASWCWRKSWITSGGSEISVPVLMRTSCWNRLHTLHFCSPNKTRGLSLYPVLCEWFSSSGSPQASVREQLMESLIKIIWICGSSETEQRFIWEESGCLSFRDMKKSLVWVWLLEIESVLLAPEGKVEMTLSLTAKYCWSAWGCFLFLPISTAPISLFHSSSVSVLWCLTEE